MILREAEEGLKGGGHLELANRKIPHSVRVATVITDLKFSDPSMILADNVIQMGPRMSKPKFKKENTAGELILLRL